MGIFVDAVKNDLVDYDYGNKDIVTSYKLGDGNHKVTIEGNKTSVKVGNGNSQISVDGDECAVLAGDGDHSISTVGNYNNTITGNGNQTVVSYGNNSNIATGNGDSNIAHFGDGGIIRTANGNNSIVSVGDGKVIQSGSGDDDVLMIGNYNFADFGDGDNNIVLYSNGSVINTGNGNDSFTTFDQIKDDEQYADYIQAFEDTMESKIKTVDTITSKTVIGQHKKHHKFKKTSVWTTYYITGYTDYFNQKICGIKNTKINTGGGSDTVNVTASKGTKVETDKAEADDVTKNKKYVYSEEYLGRKNWSRVTTSLSHHGHGKWAGGLGSSIIGTICLPGIGTVIGAYVGHDLVRG